MTNTSELRAKALSGVYSFFLILRKFKIMKHNREVNEVYGIYANRVIDEFELWG
jgi:hypothetical protein